MTAGSDCTRVCVCVCVCVCLPGFCLTVCNFIDRHEDTDTQRMVMSIQLTC